MHTVVGETDVETSIHLTEYGYFLNDGTKQVIAVGSKLLRIFRINPYYSSEPLSEIDNESNGRYVPKMECIAQYSFLAPITAISKVRLPGFQFDAIITCFDDAKVSIQYISPAKRELEIVSLHEIHQDVLSSIFQKSYTKDFVAGDPEGRCVIALVRDSFFMVIPIPEKLTTEFFDEYIEEHQHLIKRQKPRLSNYEIKLHDLDKKFHNITDFIIPSGQYVPTVIIMYEPKKTTAGRAAMEYDTFCVAAISFDLKERQSAITWQVQGLPMSLQKMIHIPEPVNGILLCGVNELIYLHQYAPGYGVRLNSNAGDYSKYYLHQANIKTVLDGVVVSLLSPYEILLGSRMGELFIATIDTDAMNSVRSISVQKVSDIPIPSSIINLSRGFLFVTSLVNNSALYAYTKRSQSKILPSLEEITKAGPIDIRELDQIDPNHDEYNKALSHYFYGETEEEVAILEAPIKEQEYIFELIQSLLNTAPFIKVVPCVAEEIDDAFKSHLKEQVFDMAAATGHEKDGKLLFMERTVRPHIGSSIPYVCLKLYYFRFSLKSILD
uniref:Cleavage/polyadenylation specificity factor A subunit N-terminal domain-containing protein n=1 Tax=Panagrolaimus superbus TaxID=310955 RepID=A0A914XUG1_9BILA